MKPIIENLSLKHLSIIDAFSCVENNDTLSQYNSKTKKRIIKHSREMEQFLKTEALEEQNKKLNTTHLLIDSNKNKLIAFISLCCDSLQLDFIERNYLEVSYQSIPAIKIARLAVSNEYRNKGIGKLMIDYAAYMAKSINQQCGVTFITLDCYQHRVSYYEKFGFKTNNIQPIQLPYDSPISMRISLNEYLESLIDTNQ